MKLCLLVLLVGVAITTAAPPRENKARLNKYKPGERRRPITSADMDEGIQINASWVGPWLSDLFNNSSEAVDEFGSSISSSSDINGSDDHDVWDWFVNLFREAKKRKSDETAVSKRRIWVDWDNELDTDEGIQINASWVIPAIQDWLTDLFTHSSEEDTQPLAAKRRSLRKMDTSEEMDEGLQISAAEARSSSSSSSESEEGDSWWSNLFKKIEKARAEERKSNAREQEASQRQNSGGLLPGDLADLIPQQLPEIPPVNLPEIPQIQPVIDEIQIDMAELQQQLNSWLSNFFKKSGRATKRRTSQRQVELPELPPVNLPEIPQIQPILDNIQIDMGELEQQLNSWLSTFFKKSGRATKRRTSQRQQISDLLPDNLQDYLPDQMPEIPSVQLPELPPVNLPEIPEIQPILDDIQIDMGALQEQLNSWLSSFFKRSGGTPSQRKLHKKMAKIQKNAKDFSDRYSGVPGLDFGPFVEDMMANFEDLIDEVIETFPGGEKMTSKKLARNLRDKMYQNAEQRVWDWMTEAWGDVSEQWDDLMDSLDEWWNETGGNSTEVNAKRASKKILTREFVEKRQWDWMANIWEDAQEQWGAVEELIDQCDEFFEDLLDDAFQWAGFSGDEDVEKPESLDPIDP